MNKIERQQKLRKVELVNKTDIQMRKIKGNEDLKAKTEIIKKQYLQQYLHMFTKEVCQMYDFMKGKYTYMT